MENIDITKEQNLKHPDYTKAQEILITLKLNPNSPQKQKLLAEFNDINSWFDIPHSSYYFGVDLDLKKLNNEKN